MRTPILAAVLAAVYIGGRIDGRYAAAQRRRTDRAVPTEPVVALPVLESVPAGPVWKAHAPVTHHFSEPVEFTTGRNMPVITLPMTGQGTVDQFFLPASRILTTAHFEALSAHAELRWPEGHTVHNSEGIVFFRSLTPSPAQ